MSCNAIDYFATLGKTTGSLICKGTSDSEVNGKQIATEIWNNAITDICIVFEGNFKNQIELTP